MPQELEFVVPRSSCRHDVAYISLNEATLIFSVREGLCTLRSLYFDLDDVSRRDRCATLGRIRRHWCGALFVVAEGRSLFGVLCVSLCCAFLWRGRNAMRTVVSRFPGVCPRQGSSYQPRLSAIVCGSSVCGSSSTRWCVEVRCAQRCGERLQAVLYEICLYPASEQERAGEYQRSAEKTCRTR